MTFLGDIADEFTLFGGVHEKEMYDRYTLVIVFHFQLRPGVYRRRHALSYGLQELGRLSD